MNTNANIREARMAAGLTQKRLSELTGIPVRTIENWDRGERTPSEWMRRLVVEEIERISDRENDLKNINSDEFFRLEIDNEEWYEKFSENFEREYDRKPIPKNSSELSKAFIQASAEEKVTIIDCLASKYCHHEGDIQFSKESYETGETIFEMKWENARVELGTDNNGIYLSARRDNERLSIYLTRMHVFCDGEGIVIEFMARHIASMGLFIINH